MRIRSNTRVEIGRLFSCLEFGERLARECALQQTAISANPKVNRFLLRQARQEAQHARIFSRVLLCLTPRGAVPVPAALHEFRTTLMRACRRRDLLETLVGQQIVLESFGELILHRMNTQFDRRGIGFKRVRRTLMHQEQGHRAFGARTVLGLLDSGETDVTRVRDLASEYLSLIDRTLDELQPLFDVVGTSAALYRCELRSGLPHWVTVTGP